MGEYLLRVKEVASILGLRPASVRKMLTQGRLQRVYPTGLRAVRVSSLEVERILREGTLHAGKQR